MSDFFLWIKATPEKTSPRKTTFVSISLIHKIDDDSSLINKKTSSKRVIITTLFSFSIKNKKLKNKKSLKTFK